MDAPCTRQGSQGSQSVTILRCGFYSEMKGPTTKKSFLIVCRIERKVDKSELCTLIERARGDGCPMYTSGKSGCHHSSLRFLQRKADKSELCTLIERISMSRAAAKLLYNIASTII